MFAVIGETSLPLLLATAMNERLPFRAVLRTAYFLPVGTSSTLVSLIWSSLFSQQGLANAMLQVVGVAHQPTWWCIWPPCRGCTTRRRSMAPHVAPPRGAIDLPGLRPLIFFVVTIATSCSMQLFEQPFITTSGGPLDATRSVVQLLYRQAFVNLYFGYGSTICMFLLVLLLVLALVHKRVHDFVVQWSTGVTTS